MPHRPPQFIQENQTLFIGLKVTNAMSLSLNKDLIQTHINPEFRSITKDSIYVFDVIDSTNTHAKKLITEQLSPKHGTIILAEKQTEGRGRLGRTFYSPSQSGIYMSIIYNINNLDPMLITALSAVAITNAIQEVYSIQASIKWVNDIFVDGKKVCGILTEGIINQKEKKIDTVIIGIGINVYVNNEGFPQDLHNIAGSLSQNNTIIHSPEFYKSSRNLLCASILNNVFSVLSCKDSELGSYLEQYKTRSFIIGKDVNVIQGHENFKARVLDITKEAHLLVQKEDGSKTELFSGEVSIRIS